MEVRVLNHSAYRTEYHIVWVTKYRHRVLKPANFKSKVESLTREIAGRIVGVKIVELNAQPEYVRMVAIIPPKYATVGVDEEMIKKYVKYQQKRDSGQAKA